jgi:cold shock protein
MKRHATVKTWLGDRGFGFLSQPDGGDDVFFHVSAIWPPKSREPREGDRVTFSVASGPDGRTRAENVEFVQWR